ncbi:MAG TPA: EAL domain-containing protein [Pseudomonadales bacterium]|nr:EAL domain-containing protein [Pseudomonadales bacterium]
MSQSETTRLLIINDDTNEVERLLSMLRNSGRNTRAQHIPSIEGLEKLLGDQAWDLLLAVDTAKSCDPKAALRSIKKLDKDIPVIFLTEADPDELNIALIDGLKAGARDVVILDDDQHLLMTMARELGNLQERRDRRAADRKLKESERRCQLLLDSSRDAIAYVEDGMFLYANQSFAERFGYEDIDDITCIPVIDLITNVDQEKYKNFMKSFKLSDEGEKELSLKGVRGDNSEFGIEIAVNHATYENDPCVQLLVAARESLDNEAVAEEIKRAGSLDALTGVYNRVYMTTAIANAIRDAAEKDKYTSLHIISIDMYDEMRSSLGISSRDAAIADIAQHIKGVVGNDGILGRIADDEFVFLTNGTDEEQQTKRGKLICESISSHICQAAGKSVQMTASIGICPITEKITNPDEVLDRAHTACQDIRNAGKGGVGNGALYFIAKLSSQSNNDALILEVLENITAKDGFDLKFQPFISLQGDSEEHYEISISTAPDAEGKVINQDEILRIATKNPTLGKKIDRWILLNTTKILAAHRSAGHNTNILVNISAASLIDESFPSWLMAALTTSGIPTQSIILQFSEADASSYLSQAITFCDEIKKANIRCSISQFGCTLDPFKTLARLNVDMVKIDNSFSIDIQHKNEKPDTLKTLIGSLNEANKRSIVPSVENATLLATLWQSGAHFIQGTYVQGPSAKMEYIFSEE